MKQDNLIAGIYLRISDDREGCELGVARQREHCIELAERLGIKIYYIYNDNDRGASRYSQKPRKDYQRLLRDARAGVVNCIIAYTSGRLTRRPREHEDQIDLAQDLGIQYFYVRSPSFDLNTSNGRRIARILASNDAGEADDISERVLDAKRKQAAKGLYLGGYRAYGYEGAKHNDKGELINRGRINVELVPHEVEVIKEGVRRIGAGETAYVVMKGLNQRGIPSPSGKQWQASNFKRQLTKKRYVIFEADGHPTGCPCLANPVGSGTLLYKGTEHRAVWPGIITRSEYELMMLQFKKVEQPWEHGLIRGRTYLLTGFTYCGGCGAICYGNARTDTKANQRRYRCKSVDNSGNKLGCGKVYRAAEPLELYVTEEVHKRFDTPEVSQALGAKDGTVDVATIAARLASLRQHKTELAAEYGRQERTKEEYQVMAAANAEAIRQAETKLAELQSKQLATTLPAASMLREVWDKSSIEWRRNVVQLLVERVDILPHGHTGSATWHGYRFNPDSVRITWREVAMADVAVSLSVLMKATRSSLALAA
jgi:DNA invertase Pin-like site-specific DNA recombinase